MAVICRLPQGVGGASHTQLINYTMLYDEGNECTEITGGWSVNGYTWGNGTIKSWTKNSTSISVNCTATTSGYRYLIGTANAIDISDFSRVYAIGTTTVSQSPNLRGQTSKIYDEMETLFANSDNEETSLSGVIIDIDVSSDNGDCYFLFQEGHRTLTSNVCNIFMVKDDNWQEWISKGGLSTDTYTTLDSVLADSEALNNLMNNQSAVNYMIYNCTGTVMAGCIQSDVALEAIRNSLYNATIYANEHWDKFLRMVGEVPESEKIYLYNKGNECVNITGGWSSLCLIPSTSYSSSGVTFNKNSDHLNLSVSTATKIRNARVQITNPIDFTDIKKICLKGTYERNTADASQCSSNFAIRENQTTETVEGTGIAFVTLSGDIGANVETFISVEINTENIIGYGYVESGNYVSKTSSCTLKIFEVWLEK